MASLVYAVFADAAAAEPHRRHRNAPSTRPRGAPRVWRADAPRAAQRRRLQVLPGSGATIIAVIVAPWRARSVSARTRPVIMGGPARALFGL
jgi:hypothetical protein